ncbi:inovirus Gp2 family protein [Shewanella acanthi]|uniref:inovirus Gp2 family protein n=1 Tax=Shewanella acanthi TaxID=2864212 RepID=UPI001C660D8E|nr:inovirus Gp2 family protein [Shewanella acanthi]QYJ77933.1 inovirus Gp2 family protein [Shewanella acanthi]
MRNRYSANTNLTVINNGLYRGYAVYPRPLSAEYLEAIYRTMNAALDEHPRTLLIRFDLHLPQLNFPDSPTVYDSTVITKFNKSLNAKILHDRHIKGRDGKRVHPCSVSNTWAKERADADTDHYHVAILLNADAYNHLGNYRHNGQNLSTKIVEAWASALGIDAHGVEHLVHFPEDTPLYYLNQNAPDFEETFAKAFFRLSYLAKLDTKHYGDRTRSFGCSQG